MRTVYVLMGYNEFDYGTLINVYGDEVTAERERKKEEKNHSYACVHPQSVIVSKTLS